MALINCPECKVEVSNRADTCPKCAYPINSQRNIPITDEKNGMSIIDWIIVLTSAIYVISPIDFVPDVVPVAGWMDDLLVGIAGISTAINSQLSKANKSLLAILKIVKIIAILLISIVGILFLFFGTVLYQIFN